MNLEKFTKTNGDKQKINETLERAKSALITYGD